MGLMLVFVFLFVPQDGSRSKTLVHDQTPRFLITDHSTLQSKCITTLQHHEMYIHSSDRDSSVCIATSYWMDGQVSIPVRVQEIFLYSLRSKPALTFTQPSIQRVSGALSPEVKRPGREN
jgi:hypothetical protein